MPAAIRCRCLPEQRGTERLRVLDRSGVLREGRAASKCATAAQPLPNQSPQQAVRGGAIHPAKVDECCIADKALVSGTAAGSPVCRPRRSPWVTLRRLSQTSRWQERGGSHDSASRGEREAFRSMSSSTKRSRQRRCWEAFGHEPGKVAWHKASRGFFGSARAWPPAAARHGDLTDSFVLSSTGPILNEGRVVPTALKEVPHAYEVTGRAAPLARPTGRRPNLRKASGRPSPPCCHPSRAPRRRHRCAGLALGPSPTGDSRAGRQTGARGSREGSIRLASGRA
jgi:hypothetical protein